MNRPKKTKTVMLRLSPTMYKHIVQKSMVAEKSVPEIIRLCVEKFLQQN